MNKYVATFHTHHDAMRFLTAREDAGAPAKIAPVPLALSASCGACVYFEADEPPAGADAVYLITSGKKAMYTKIC